MKIKGKLIEIVPGWYTTPSHPEMREACCRVTGHTTMSEAAILVALHDANLAPTIERAYRDIMDRKQAVRVDHLYAPMRARASFKDRGFSDRTIEALVKAGLDAPERLLFIAEQQIRRIAGIGPVSLTEIMGYRERFLDHL